MRTPAFVLLALLVAVAPRLSAQDAGGPTGTPLPVYVPPPPQSAPASQDDSQSALPTAPDASIPAGQPPVQTDAAPAVGSPAIGGLDALPTEPGWHLPHVFGLDLFLGTPSAFEDIFRSGSVGASLRWLASDRFEFGLDYFFLGFQYYYPNQDGSWSGPIPWSSVPTGFSSPESDWIFYQSTHMVAPMAWYLGQLGELHARFGLGPALSFVIPSESAKYYPGLAQQFTVFASQFKAYVGWILHVGLEYHPIPLFAIGLDYLFIISDFIDFSAQISNNGWNYAKRAGNLVLYAGIRI